MNSSRSATWVRRALTILSGATIFSVAGVNAQRPIYLLDTLTVHVGARSWNVLPVAARSVEVLDRARIAALPAQSVADLLAWMVGVDVQPRSPAQADLAIRGSSFEQVLVLVDGVRMSDAQTGHFDLDLATPLDEIERIEVLRGPASAQYGSDALGGVVNIVTRREAGTSARVEGGSFASGGASLGGGSALAGGRWRAGAEYRRSDGARPGTEYETGQARTTLGVPWQNNQLRMELAYAARNFGAADFYAPVNLYDSYEETRTYTASLALLPAGAQRITLEPRLSVRRHDDDFILQRDDPDFYRNQHANWLIGGEVIGRYAATSNIRLALGGELFRDAIESNALGDRAATRGAVYGEFAAGRTRRWLGTSGLRADWHSEFGVFLAPSLAAAFWPHERLRLRASAGRSFRAPTWTERYYEDPNNIGNPDLEPEQSWTGELGAELSFASARIDVAGFIRAADQLIDWARSDGTSTPWRTLNIEDAAFGGAEAMIELQGPLAMHWSLSATALSVESDEGAGYESKYALTPLTRTITLSVDRPIFEGIGLALRARHARRRGASSYQTIDLRTSYSRATLRVYADATNLSDADYRDLSNQPVPGRALRVGVDWKRSH